MSAPLATIHHDLIALVIGVALCTIAAGLFGFALLGRNISKIDLPVAAAFAGSYGIRLLLTIHSAALLLSDPPWLPYAQSALEYVVPIAGSLLLERFFGDRLRPVNRLMVLAFVACAIVALPFEIATRHPFAFRDINNAIVDVFLVVYAVNIFMPAPIDSADWRILRIASAIFGLYVVNAHAQWFHDPLGLTSEPVGLLIYIGTVVFALIRHTVRNQMRVASVDGELAAARQIQMSILPKHPPEIRGLDLAAVYSPASEVAGDFFDFVVVDDRRVGILVADVSGHGVPAAIVASMLKVAFSSHLAQAGEPAKLLHELNAFFCGKLERQFITASYALIDPAAGHVRVANAGHPRPVIVRADTTVEEIVADGVLMGRFRDARFAEAAASIRSGDALVLYTDGIPEALDPAQQMWGEARFHEAAASAISETAGTIAQRVLERLRSWAAAPADDVTLVVAKQVSV